MPPSPEISPEPRPIQAEIVLLVGPSGCGKTHLAQLAGLPTVSLDDFYRAGTDPNLPRTPAGVVNWDDPASWDAEAAMEALTELCHGERVKVPTYSIGADRAIGSRVIDRHRSSIVVAEGIFAAELIHRLRAAGLLADALLIVQNRWTTFARRLVRDLREGRKAPWYLVRQGWAKTRSEPAVIRHQRRCGARPVSKPVARARLAGLAARGLVADASHDAGGHVDPVTGSSPVQRAAGAA